MFVSVCQSKMEDQAISCPWCTLDFDSVSALCAHLQDAHPQEWRCALSMLTRALRPSLSPDSHAQIELPCLGIGWPQLPFHSGTTTLLQTPPGAISHHTCFSLGALAAASSSSSSSSTSSSSSPLSLLLPHLSSTSGPLFSRSHISLHPSSRLLSSLPRLSLRSPSTPLVPFSSLSLPSSSFSSSSSSRCQAVAVWRPMGREGSAGQVQAQRGEPHVGFAWMEDLLMAELEQKSIEVCTAKKEREKLRGARDELEHRNAQLKRQLTLAAEMMAGLRQEVLEKERELDTKERQVCELSVFLRDTAVRESEAKLRLQSFIEDLLERADTAETLLLDKHARYAHAGYNHAHTPAQYTPLHTPAHQQYYAARYAHTPHCRSSGAGLNGTYQRSQSVSVVSGHTYQQQASPDKRWPQGVKRTLSLGAACVCEQGCVCGRKWCLCEQGCVCVSSDEGGDGDDTWSADTSQLSLWPHTPSRDLSQAVCPFCGKPSPSAECVCVALRCVFGHLDVRSLLAVGAVCRAWRNVSRHSSLWTHVTLKDAHISSMLLVSLSRWCCQTRSLTMRNLSAPRHYHETREEHYRRTRGCLEAGLEALLRTTGRSLLKLTVTECPNILTDRCVWLASCYCRSLHTLTYRSATDPVGQEVIWALGAGCRNISSLQVAPLQPCLQPSRFGNRCLQLIGRCWPQLSEVGVGGACCGVQGLLSLVRNCVSLRRLQLHGVCEVSVCVARQLCREGLRCLETLEFHATPVTPDALLHFHSMCGQLRCVLVQASIRDYFQDPDTEEAHRHFNQTINKMQALQSSILSGILHVQMDRC